MSRLASHLNLAGLVACCVLLMSGCGAHSVDPMVDDTASLPDPDPIPASAPNYPRGDIEQTYFERGPWRVSAVKEFACCDSSGAAYDVWYPTELGRGGFRHPILAWGNGTDAVPTQYAYLLSHLASWGFVIIASEDTGVGNGVEILDSIHFILDANDDPASRFYRRLAVDRIGALGHSQGAGGVVNATINEPGLIDALLTLEKPAQMFCTGDAPCPSTAGITQGAVFYINGSLDFPIAPSTQLPLLPGEQSHAVFYANTPNTAQKLWATLNGANHNDIQGQPSCATASFPCGNGLYGYLGYPTAWFMDQLQDDDFAHGAFVSGSGEIFSQGANWSNAVSNIQ